MEEFVTFDIAVKLREKGFTKKCLAAYIIEDYWVYNRDLPVSNRETFFSHNSYNNMWHKDYYDAPTISQVLKWLREVKGIDVLPQRGHINLDNNGKATRYYNVNIYFERRFACTLDNDEQDYSTYEQAAIAGVNYCLENLI